MEKLSEKNRVKQLEAVELMNGLMMPLEQITSDLSDSLTLAGSEAYVSSLAIYNTVKRAEKMGVTGLRPIYEELKKYFKHRGRRSETPDNVDE